MPHVFADAAAAALPAIVAPPPVLANAAATRISFALAAAPTVLAAPLPPRLFARTASPLVTTTADAFAAAVLAEERCRLCLCKCWRQRTRETDGVKVLMVNLLLGR